MNTQFTKEEAINYLGEVFMFKNEFIEMIENEPKRVIKSGEVGKVQSVDIWTGEIKLSVDVYGNYYSFDKHQFESHCVILKPEIVAHQPHENLH